MIQGARWPETVDVNINEVYPGGRAGFDGTVEVETVCTVAE